MHTLVGMIANMIGMAFFTFIAQADEWYVEVPTTFTKLFLSVTGTAEALTKPSISSW